MGAAWYIAGAFSAVVVAQRQLDGLAASTAWMVAYAAHAAWFAGPRDSAPPFGVWSEAVDTVERMIMSVLASPLPTDRRVAWSELAVAIRIYRGALVGSEARPGAFAESTTRAAFVDVGTRLANLDSEAERGEARVAELLEMGEGRALVPRIRSIVGDVAADATARSGDIACRYGGEEFMLLLPGADESSATLRAESLPAAIAGAEASLDGRRLPSVTASLGVAVAAGRGIDAAKLTRAADQALYAAKRAGRDRVSVAVAA